MNADIQGALNQINRSWKAFTHRGKRMTKDQVTRCLKYGLEKGYKTTDQLTDEEVDEIIEVTERNHPAFQKGVFIGTD